MKKVTFKFTLSYIDYNTSQMMMMVGASVAGEYGNFGTLRNKTDA